MENDCDKLKPNFKTVNATLKIENQNNDMSYFELLTKISRKEIETKNLKIKDNNNIVWTFDCNGDFIRDDNFGTEFLSEHYSDVELPQLRVQPLNSEPEQSSMSKATQKVLLELENMYMDLNMTIDNCQGCMDNLDEAFDRLNIYKCLIEFLGGNVKDNYQRMVEDWYSKRRIEEQKEQERKHPIFPKTQSSFFDFVMDDSLYGKTFADILLTINEISNKLNEQQKEN